MVNRNTNILHKLGIIPDHILEIRLPLEVWEKVVRIAAMKKRSCSWVVRYCVFRLIKRKDPVRYITNYVLERGKRDKWVKFQTLQRRAEQQKSRGNLHRHKLCLYGEDEFFIRMTAGLMRCTMSHLVRLAMEWNLDELERLSDGRSSRFHSRAFYWLGIKLYGGVELPTCLPEERTFLLSRFREAEYW